MLNILAYVLIGAVAGVLSGLFGIGGGIVIIPMLVIMQKFPQLRAQGTSLVAMLPPVGIFAFMQYYKKGNVDIVAGLIICAAMLVFANFGGILANHLPTDVMKKGECKVNRVNGLYSKDRTYYFYSINRATLRSAPMLAAAYMVDGKLKGLPFSSHL